MKKIVQKIYEAPNEGGLRALATQVAKTRFDLAVDQMQRDFEEHPVTQELDGGVGATNISETLRGHGPTENLFSFIGLQSNEGVPTDPIRKRLDPANPEGPHLSLVGKDNRGTSIRYQFIVTAPNEKAIYKDTQVPWTQGGGFSWAEKIESHIPGFASFLYGEDYPQSRSGGGIQAKVGGRKDGEPQVLRGDDYMPPKNGYIQTIFRNFIERLKKFR